MAKRKPHLPASSASAARHCINTCAKTLHERPELGGTAKVTNSEQETVAFTDQDDTTRGWRIRPLEGWKIGKMGVSGSISSNLPSFQYSG
jgi:hypothetical protein